MKNEFIELTQRAQAGDATAQYSLGWSFAHGYGWDANFKQSNITDLNSAAKWYTAAAKQNHVLALNALAALYVSGQGVPLDVDSAIALWKKSAEQDDIIAEYSLGCTYIELKDFSQAKLYLERAANKGNFAAQYQMGILYENGWGVTKDLIIAQSWYQKSAKQGYPLAKAKLLSIKILLEVEIDPSQVLRSTSSSEASSTSQDLTQSSSSSQLSTSQSKDLTASSSSLSTQRSRSSIYKREQRLSNANAPPIEYDELTDFKRIGKGSCATVYSAKYGSKLVAVKQLDMDDDGLCNDFNIDHLLKEAEQMVSLRSEHIVTLYNFCRAPVYCLILELMDRSLDALLRDKTYDLNGLQRYQFALDIAKGLRFLHQHKVIHRDIKPSNVLLDTHNRAKLSDFGFTLNYITDTQSDLELEDDYPCGSIAYLAPELLGILTGNEEKRYNEKTDIYAFGVVLWELMSRIEPYHELQPLEKYKKIPEMVMQGKRPKIHADASSVQFQHLIKSCWAQESDSRIDLTTVIHTLESLITAEEQAIKDTHRCSMKF